MLVVIVLFGLVIFVQVRTLPQVEGTLKLDGLNANVIVSRESPYGVIHIEAQNDHDMYFAQGVVEAQERCNAFTSFS